MFLNNKNSTVHIFFLLYTGDTEGIGIQRAEEKMVGEERDSRQDQRAQQKTEGG